MARFATLLGLALLVAAEVAALMFLVDALGAGGAMLVLAADMLLGLLVMRWAARGPAADRGWRIAGGAVIALPGLVLDLVGLALLVRPVREWLKGHIVRRTESALRRRGVSVVTVTDQSGVRRTTVVPGDVISGEVLDEPAGPTMAPGTPTDRGGSSPNPGPRVVRGEIAGTEE